MDHESILNLFVENRDAGKQLLEYCYMGKVLPSKMVLDPATKQPELNSNTGKPLLLSTTAHISFSNPQLDILSQPNTLINLSKMVKSLQATFPDDFQGHRDAEVYRNFAWSVIQKAGKQLSLQDLENANAETAGFFCAGDLSKLQRKDIKGLIYIYLMDATLPAAQYIANQFKGGKLKAEYEQILFAFCASGAIDVAKLGDDPKGIASVENVKNVMMYCNLLGGDAMMQAGMGTSSEFAYSVINGCSDSKLLVWPMEGQDEHASNARFMAQLFPKNVTQIGKLNFGFALDDLVKARTTAKDGQWKPYGFNYIEAITNDNTIAAAAAAVLFEERALAQEVVDALLNVSNPDLKCTYRLMKICVQMLDQLEGPNKPTKGGEKPGDGPFPYGKFLKPGDQFVIGLKQGVYKTFKNPQEAIQFFGDPVLIANFLQIADVKNFAKIYADTEIAAKVIEALKPGDQLVQGFARYALKDIADRVKSGV
jgi:hypothetical protein